jgi:hypothetical protein
MERGDLSIGQYKVGKRAWAVTLDDQGRLHVRMEYVDKDLEYVGDRASHMGP